MLIAATYSLLLGAVLAQGYRVWILLPLCTVLVIGVSALGVFINVGFFYSLGHGIANSVALQLGFGLGLFFKVTIDRMKLGRIRLALPAYKKPNKDRERSI